ncbi:MAG: cyanase [Gammaproteobacteria bacterium HGW-Gammaproteobacteria-10]|nr:MAG: cyanase [Gammaproteobacteria bacterium HGW-Gammaproteobacteria-10]
MKTTPSSCKADSLLTKEQMTDRIITAKVQKQLTWTAIAEQIGVDEVWLTSACLGMNSMKPDLAEKLCAVLELPNEVQVALAMFPYKQWAFDVPQDPLIYRLYEVVGVYGETLKEIIHEKFGDGIMSAIDFSMTVGKEENPAGDRVIITMNGKFLPYKSW